MVCGVAGERPLSSKSAAWNVWQNGSFAIQTAMSKFLIRSFGLALFVALFSRIILVSIQVHIFAEPDFKFWEMFFGHSPLAILKNIDLAATETIRLITLTPIIEGVFFALTIYLALKVKLPKPLIAVVISILAYFLHAPIGNQFYGFQGGAFFFVLTLMYFYAMKSSSKPHTYGYIVTTVAHAIYNFIGVYLVSLYTLASVF